MEKTSGDEAKGLINSFQQQEGSAGAASSSGPQSRWLNPGADRPKYDPRVGNLQNDTLMDILTGRPGGAWPTPPDKASGFAQVFKQKPCPPETKHTDRQPVCPVQLGIGADWPNQDPKPGWVVDPVEGSNWVKGIDNNAKAVVFGTNRLKCKGCDIAFAVEPICPICEVPLCFACIEEGKHDSCGGAGLDKKEPDVPWSHAEQPSFLSRPAIPTEPHLNRPEVKANPKRLHVDEFSWEMREIYNISSMNLDRLREADEKKAEQREKAEESHRGRSRYRNGEGLEFEQPTHATPESRKSAAAASSGWNVVASTHSTITIDKRDVECLYSGTDVECGLCAQKFRNGERVCRLQCRHAFHYSCIEHHKNTVCGDPDQSCCPHCHGVAKVIAVWDFIGLGPDTQEGRDGVAVPNLMHAQRSSGNHTVERDDEVISCSPTRSRSRDAVEPVFERVPGAPLKAKRFASLSPERRRRATPSEERPRSNSREASITSSQLAEQLGYDRSSYPSWGTSAEDHNNWNCSSSFRLTKDGLQDSKDNCQKKVYQSDVQLPNGRMSVMLDIGSVGNLAGSQWMIDMAKLCLRHGRKPASFKRDRPLSVSGVGTGAQCCTYNCHVPCAIPTLAGQGVGSYLKGTYKAPCVPNSTLPALMGLESLEQSRAVIDCNTGKVYFLGPGDYKLADCLPPGTKCIQCEHAPSGHLMMPIDEFGPLDVEEKRGGLEIEKEVVLPVRQKVD